MQCRWAIRAVNGIAAVWAFRYYSFIIFYSSLVAFLDTIKIYRNSGTGNDIAGWNNGT